MAPKLHVARLSMLVGRYFNQIFARMIRAVNFFLLQRRGLINDDFALLNCPSAGSIPYSAKTPWIVSLLAKHFFKRFYWLQFIHAVLYQDST